MAWDLVQLGFEYFQRRRLHNLSGQPFPVFGHSYGKTTVTLLQVFFLHLNGISYIPVCAHCLLYFLWIPLRRLWLSRLYFPPNRYLYTLTRSPSPASPCIRRSLMWVEYLSFPLTLVDAEDLKESAGIKPWSCSVLYKCVWRWSAWPQPLAISSNQFCTGWVAWPEPTHYIAFWLLFMFLHCFHMFRVGIKMRGDTVPLVFYLGKLLNCLIYILDS